MVSPALTRVIGQLRRERCLHGGQAIFKEPSMNLTLSAHSVQMPLSLRAQLAARKDDGCVSLVGPRTSRPLYTVPVTMKPRTVTVLLNHALERLAPFGIPDLAQWAVDVSQTDDDYQVDFKSAAGAVLSVCAIQLTTNKCGVVCDFGLAASVD